MHYAALGQSGKQPIVLRMCLLNAQSVNEYISDIALLMLLFAVLKKKFALMRLTSIIPLVSSKPTLPLVKPDLSMERKVNTWVPIIVTNLSLECGMLTRWIG